MKTLAAILLLAGLAVALPAPRQDPDRLQELLGKLDDDSIEVRAASAAALAELGPGAVPALTRAAATESVELKDRLAEVIRKIRDREKIAALLPPPSRVTLRAVDCPLREVFEKISKQSSTPIDYSALPEGAKVTVTLDSVPVWRAIEQVCAASGKAMPDLQTNHVAILDEPYVALPGRITDRFSVTLQKVELSTEVTFGQVDRLDRFSSVFRVAWERGSRPYHVTARIAELVDEAGNELVGAGEEIDSPAPAAIAHDMISQELPLDCPRGPGPEARKIGRLRVEFELEFPLRFATVKIDLSSGKLPIAASCAEFDAKLARLDRQEGAALVSLVVTPHGALEGEVTAESIVLRDKNGKEYSPIVTEGTPGGENETPFQLVFPVAQDAGDFRELRIRIPVEVHRERVDVELKNLDLK